MRGFPTQIFVWYISPCNINKHIVIKMQEKINSVKEILITPSMVK